MKIVVTGRYFRNDDITDGVIVHIHYLSQHLSRLNTSVDIVTLGDKNCLFVEGDVRVHIVKRLINGITTPFDALVLRKKIMEINPDVVHAHDSGYPYSTTLLMLPKKLTKVVTVHGNIRYEVDCLKKISLQGYIGGIISLFNQYLILRFIKKIIAVTPYITKLLNRQNIMVIPNGFDYVEYSTSSYSVNLKSDLFYIGGLSYIKGVDILIKAIPAVKNKFPDLKVYIAGSGHMENELKGLVRELSLTDTIQFIGYVSGVHKYDYIKSSKVCVVPSRSDMAPGVLLEIMACGRPVIASNAGGIPHIIDDGVDGILFENGNVTQLSEKIISLMSDESRLQELGKKAEQKIKRSYDWQSIARQTLKFYYPP